MKRTAALLLSLLALGASACPSNSRGAPDARARRPPMLNRDGGGIFNLRDRPDLGEATAAALATLFRERQQPVEVQGDTLRSGAHSVTFTVRSADPVAQPQGMVVPVELNVSVDGVLWPGLRSNQIGREAAPREAELQALREFEVGVGRALVPALLERWGLTADGGTYALPLGPMRVFPGPVGVRGQAPDTHGMEAPAFQRELLSALEPRLDALLRPEQRAGYHSFQVLLHVRGGRAQQNMCRVDGQPSTTLCEVLRARTWPGDASSDYLLRETWILAGP